MFQLQEHSGLDLKHIRVQAPSRLKWLRRMHVKEGPLSWESSSLSLAWKIPPGLCAAVFFASRRASGAILLGRRTKPDLCIGWARSHDGRVVSGSK